MDIELPEPPPMQANPEDIPLDVSAHTQPPLFSTFLTAALPEISAQ